MALLTGAELAENLEIAYVAPDAAVLDDVALAASDLIGYLITAAAVTAEPAACKQATMSVGVEIFQARTAAGGESVSTDFTAGPYRLSVWVTKRVMALLTPYLDMKTQVG
mgnify:FL=1|tara:strand:+ start:1042 stop:1371 length:330 start_codon:yes stop_codon:yes gene_type:complete